MQHTVKETLPLNIHALSWEEHPENKTKSPHAFCNPHNWLHKLKVASPRYVREEQVHVLVSCMHSVATQLKRSSQNNSYIGVHLSESLQFECCILLPCWCCHLYIYICTCIWMFTITMNMCGTMRLQAVPFTHSHGVCCTAVHTCASIRIYDSRVVAGKRSDMKKHAVFDSPQLSSKNLIISLLWGTYSQMLTRCTQKDHLLEIGSSFHLSAYGQD